MEDLLQYHTARFLRLFEENIKRDGADALLDWLKKSDFFKAPASTKYHGAYEGGLLEHSLNVFDCLLGELASMDMTGRYSGETVAIVSLLHDVCKIGLYTSEPKNQKTYDPTKVNAAARWEIKHDSLGDYVWETVMGYKVDDQLPYGHGEKSVYILSGFMRLTREEAMAIRWHMGFSDNDFRGGGQSVGKAFEMYPLAVLTHLADMKATYLLEREGDSNSRTEKPEHEHLPTACENP